MRRGLAFIVVALIALLAPRAGAHDGPPYPVFVDQVRGPFRISVWGDPDVGIGTFFIYLEPTGTTPLPNDCAVEMFVQPVDRHIPEAGYRATPREHRKGPLRFDAHVRFETEDSWRVRIRVSSAAGTNEVATVVAATPPGQGPVLDFILYLFPFVAIGFLFVKAALKRRTADHTLGESDAG